MSENKGQYTVLKELDSCIMETKAVAENSNIEPPWDEAIDNADEHQDNLVECLNELGEKFDELDRLFTDWDTAPDYSTREERHWGMTEFLRGFLRLSK